EGLDRSRFVPLLEASLPIVQEAARALVAVLRHLREELQNDALDRLRYSGRERRRRRRRAGDVTMHPFDRIARLEGAATGEHLIKDDTERVEVAATVERPIRSPGLLGREVGQRSLDEPRGTRARNSTGQARRDSEACNPHLPGLGVHEDVLGLQILVDEAMPVNVGDGADDSDCEREELLDRHRRTDVEWPAAEI